MKNLLIIENSEILVDSLKSGLQNEWSIYASNNGYPTDLLKHFEADALLLNLNTTPAGGLSVLREATPNLPRIIIATSNYIDDRVIQDLRQFGCSALVRIPYRTGYVRDLLNQLCKDCSDSSNAIIRHFHILKINPKLTGYRYLVAATSLYADCFGLMKQIYIEVAQLYRIGDPRNVERAMRTVIGKAWEQREPEVWRCYFPSEIKPSNKEFISRLAEIISP